MRNSLALFGLSLFFLVSSPRISTAAPGLIRSWGGFGTSPGQFNNPYGIVLDANQVVYVTDEANNRIQSFDSTGVFLSQWGSYGTDPGFLFNPTGIDIGPDGLAYISDHQNHRISVFTREGAFVRTITGILYPVGLDCEPSGNFWVAGFSGLFHLSPTGGTLQALHNDDSPYGVTADGNTLYASLCSGNRVDKITLSPLFEETFAGSGLYCPEGSLLDGNGNFLVCDTGHDRVVKYDPDGQLIAQLQLSTNPRAIPSDIALDSKGDLYITEWGLHKIEKYSSSVLGTTTPNQPPDCSGAFANVAPMFPADHKMTPVPIDGVVDPEGGPVTVEITGITQDEPVDKGGFCPDAQILPDGSALVRRERERNGRVYRIDFTATDAEGASCNAVVRVCVPASRTKLECVEDALVYDSLGPCPAGVIIATGINQVEQRGAMMSVDYTTAQPAPARLELFDVAGRRVGTLVNETLEAGSHSTAWNAGQLPKGIYFLRMQSGNDQDVRRTFIR